MQVHASSRTNFTRDRLLQKFGNNLDMLALGGAVSRVVELASSDNGAAHILASCVLSDVALTQKILRLANSVCYRSSASPSVTTISRAIFLLGFDTIKINALTMLLVDNLPNGKQADHVKIELIDALCASLVGREMARQSRFHGAEEASIAALFKNLGRLLLASHEHQLYNDVLRLISQEKLSPTQASFQILECSFDFLTETILHEWNIPESIIQATSPIPNGKIFPAKNAAEWMRQVATFSAEAARLIMHTHDPASNVGGQALLARFAAALNLDKDSLARLFSTVSEEIHHTIQSCDLLPPLDNTDEITAPIQPVSLPPALQSAFLDAIPTQDDAHHASGKPIHASNLLLAGVQDATQMTASGHHKPEQQMLLILETLYRSMGFRFATLCLKNKECGLFLAHMAIGEHHAARQAGFVFPVKSGTDLFHAAMDNDVDLMIADATSPQIRDLLPTWHHALLPDARSMIVLPLVSNHIPLGLFYADRAKPAPEGMLPAETALIKILKGQLLAALLLR